MHAAALLLLVAPAGFALVAMVARTGRVRALERCGAVASTTGVLVATAAAVAVAVAGPVTSRGATVDGLGLSLRADALSVTVLLMVTVLAAVIFRYSARLLDGEPRRPAFLGRLAATVAELRGAEFPEGVAPPTSSTPITLAAEAGRAKSTAEARG